MKIKYNRRLSVEEKYYILQMLDRVICDERSIVDMYERSNRYFHKDMVRAARKKISAFEHLRYMVQRHRV